MGFRRYIATAADEIVITRREADKLTGLGIIDSGHRDDVTHSVIFRLRPYMDAADALHEIGRCVPFCNCFVNGAKRRLAIH